MHKSLIGRCKRVIIGKFNKTITHMNFSVTCAQAKNLHKHAQASVDNRKQANHNPGNW